MKCSRDFKAIALDALRGKWWVAVLTGFIASLMGACIATSGGGNSNSNSSERGSHAAIIQDFRAAQFWEHFGMLITIGIVLIVVWFLITIVISGAGKLGYATFNLKLVDHKDASLSDLFSQFHRLGTGFCMNFLQALYLFLWSLLIIPGIIKGYSYAMTPYILAEHPELGANEAITRSREIMDGNKWRLFCLGFSFIGWGLLCALPTLLTLGAIAGIAYRTQSLAVFLWLIPAGIPSFIGYLFLRPYQEAAYAAFYRDVSGTEAYTVLPDYEGI